MSESRASSKPEYGPTLTYRSVLIGLAAMVFAAIWSHWHEILSPAKGTLSENSPPASAVGVFFGILLILSLLSLLRTKLKLAKGELVVIYAMVIVAAPLFSQGLWQRFIGFIVAIPYKEAGNNQWTLYDSFSEKLWPHGPPLIEDPRFEGDAPPWTVEGPGSARIVEIEKSQVGATRGLRIEAGEAPGDVEVEDTVVRIPVPRVDEDGVVQLVHGERYFASVLLNLEDPNDRSSVQWELESDGGTRVQIVSILRSREDLPYGSPGGFVRTGDPEVVIPRDMDEGVSLMFTLQGPGSVTITDVTLFSNEALARLHTGTSELPESLAPRAPPTERDALLIRPDSILSPSGLWYTLKGYTPWGQWFRPLAYWFSIILAVFLCLLGLAVIFRRQWADNERFTFPLVVLPKLLIEQKDEDGRLVRPLFRHPMFHVGLTVMLVYCFLVGLAHYVPGSPSPLVQLNLADQVTWPPAKAYFQGGYGNQFEIMWMIVAIAFFIDLSMLASILIALVLLNFGFMIGELTGLKNEKGVVGQFPFMHQQHIGGFLTIALMVVWISRRHLAGVSRRVLGLSGGVDDSGEAMSYRAATAMIVVSFVFFGVWGAMTGLGVASSLLFFGFIVVCGLSAARIRTEVGAPWTYFTPYFPYLIFFLLGGLSVFSLETMVLAFAVGGFMAVAQFLMFAPSQVEMLHLGNQFNARPRGVMVALVLGLVGGVLLGGYVLLVPAYGVGGDNIQNMAWPLNQNWYFSGLNNAVRDADFAAQAEQLGSETVDEDGTWDLGAVGFGAGVTALLTFLRTRFVGFWFNPIGYVLANAFFVYMVWGSLLVAFLVKWIALRVGGPRLIRDQLTPMFAGVFVGGLIALAGWDLVAVIATSQGVRDVFTFPVLP